MNKVQRESAATFSNIDTTTDGTKPGPNEQRYVDAASLEPHYASISPSHSETEYCTLKELTEQQQQHKLSNSAPYRSQPLGI